ncbi:hypothetical protein PPE_01057 [Paenibacillus polymyxa E681]|nr:hypothetical protein PPE_01057 [Paenibacillus polymyxa E681]
MKLNVKLITDNLVDGIIAGVQHASGFYYDFFYNAVRIDNLFFKEMYSTTSSKCLREIWNYTGERK